MGGYKRGGRGEGVSRSLKMSERVIEASANIVCGGVCAPSPFLPLLLPFIGQGEKGEGRVHKYKRDVLQGYVPESMASGVHRP